MAIYIVGDIQGCFLELKALLQQVNFNPTYDQLMVAGDLVARGPYSLETLRFIKGLGNSAKVVLGNHDLHLLATYAGIKKVKTRDKLTALLAAPDIAELMDWLAQQPLLQQLPNEAAFMSHAGISPQWHIKDAIAQAEFAHQCLLSNKRNYWLSMMYGEQPNNWQQVTTDEERFRYTVNAFTRMRYCYLDLTLEFSCKEAPEQAPSSIKPWFELASTLKDNQWVFGHWAALMGKCEVKNTYALDTGCVWGEYLSLLRWHDKKIFTQEKMDEI